MSLDDDDQDGREPSPSAPAKKKKKKKPAAKETGASISREEISREELERGARAERSIRLQLMLAAAGAIVGIALVGTGPSLPGMVLVIAGVLGLVVGIHRFGRLGPEG